MVSLAMYHKDVSSFDILTSKDIEREDVCEIFIFNGKYRLGSIANITNKILDTDVTDIGRDFDEDELADLPIVHGYQSCAVFRGIYYHHLPLRIP